MNANTPKHDENPADGRSASNGELGWVPVSEGMPDFKVHGFHTGRTVMVRRIDGSEEETIYQGYGLFGNGISMFLPVTHWKPNCEVTGSPKASPAE